MYKNFLKIITVFFLGLIPVFAGMALPEGIYTIGPSTVVVDLTAPTGELYVEYDAVTATQANGQDEGTYITIPPAVPALYLHMNVHDNFENPPLPATSQFDRWELYRSVGTSDWSTPTPTCTAKSAYSIYNSGTNYGDAIQLSDTTTSSANCYQYELRAYDVSGNTLSGVYTQEVFGGDGTNPEVEVSGDHTQAFTNSDFSLAGDWDKRSVDIEVQDAESGIDQVNCYVAINGAAEVACGAEWTTDTALSNYSYDLATDGKHELRVEVIDAFGNTVNASIGMWRDETAPTNTITISSLALAGEELNLDITVDDTNGGVDVSEVSDSDISLSIGRCNKVGCDQNVDADWIDIIADTDWYRETSITLPGFSGTAVTQTRASRVEFYHSPNYQNSYDGVYRIKIEAQDTYGNSSSTTETINVKPNQLDSMQESSACAAMIADADTACTITLSFLDAYSNPLYSKGIDAINLDSDTYLDQIHSSGNKALKIDTGAVHTYSVGSGTYTTDLSGSITVDIVGYAPGSGNANISADMTEHTAAAYPVGGAATYNESSSTAYTVDKIWADPAAWRSSPSVLDPISAALDFEIDTPKYSGANDILNLAANFQSRLGVYVYDDFDGKWTQNHISNAPADTQLTMNLITADAFLVDGTEFGKLTGSDDTVMWLGSTGTNTDYYEFKLQFTDTGAIMGGSNTISVMPFVYYQMNGEGVAYKLPALELVDIPFNPLTAKARGAGFTQGSGSEVTDDDIIVSTLGNISIDAVSSYLKNTVKRQILSLDEVSSGDTNHEITAGADDNGFDRENDDIALINNGQSYVVKGDNHNLVIDGDIEIGSKPVAFITYGGDIIIRGNVTYAGAVKPSIAFISLRNEKTGTGGNILIANVSNTEASPGVKAALSEIAGSLIAERGIVSVKETSDSTSFVGIERDSLLTNQLLITGNIVAKNTLGGSSKATPECPSFIRRSSCTSDIARMYDLNHLRRYASGLDDVVTQNYITIDATDERPVVIEYYINKELLPIELQN